MANFDEDTKRARLIAAFTTIIANQKIAMYISDELIAQGRFK